MAAAVGLTLIKNFLYRGDALEEYSNQYWFTGDVPADSTAWKALADALITQEKTIYPTDVQVIRAYGYDSDADDAVSVWSYDYLAVAEDVNGTLTVGTCLGAPGDGAVWVRWKTNRLNSNGKAVYLRKYFHLAMSTGSTGNNRDVICPAQKTALENFGTKLMDASFISARTITARGHDDTILSRKASDYLTTRTLKRRGRRPTA